MEQMLIVMDRKFQKQEIHQNAQDDLLVVPDLERVVAVIIVEAIVVDDLLGELMVRIEAGEMGRVLVDQDQMEIDPLLIEKTVKAQREEEVIALILVQHVQAILLEIPSEVALEQELQDEARILDLKADFKSVQQVRDRDQIVAQVQIQEGRGSKILDQGLMELDLIADHHQRDLEDQKDQDLIQHHEITELLKVEEVRTEMLDLLVPLIENLTERNEDFQNVQLRSDLVQTGIADQGVARGERLPVQQVDLFVSQWDVISVMVGVLQGDLGLDSFCLKSRFFQN
jgi:hypothetical protein